MVYYHYGMIHYIHVFPIIHLCPTIIILYIMQVKICIYFIHATVGMIHKINSCMVGIYTNNYAYYTVHM